MTQPPQPPRVLDQRFERDVPLEQVRVHPRNPRRGDLDQIEGSIEANDFYGALIVQQSTGHILVGNHRYLAAQRAGIDALPVLWVDVDDARAERIALVDNRTNDLASYDQALLLELLEVLPDLTGTGYTTAALQELERAVRGVPPEGFPEVGDDLATDYRCPRCGYEWSGKAAPPGGTLSDADLAAP
jgi:ParB-like chromosome segregation protein Spo0J